MFGNRYVELAVKLGGQADVGTVLPDAFVAQNAQRLAVRRHCAASSRRHHFVTNEVKPDDLGHGAGHAIAKMTVHRIFDHLAQLDQVLALGNDAVPKGRRHIAPIDLVFLHLEDDLAHARNVGGCLSSGKPRQDGGGDDPLEQF
jgi:hypothetical protein